MEGISAGGCWLGLVPGLQAIRAGAVGDYFEARYLESGGIIPNRVPGLQGCFHHILDVPALAANQMVVIGQIGIIAGGLALERNLVDQALPVKHIQNLVNRGQGYVWQVLPYAGIHGLGGRVGIHTGQHGINRLPLPRELESSRLATFREFFNPASNFPWRNHIQPKQSVC